MQGRFAAGDASGGQEGYEEYAANHRMAIGRGKGKGHSRPRVNCRQRLQADGGRKHRVHGWGSRVPRETLAGGECEDGTRWVDRGGEQPLCGPIPCILILYTALKKWEHGGAFGSAARGAFHRGEHESALGIIWVK